ncbi:MAG: hypothetical protein IPN91_13705 [Holophagaceae bacterium]|uniref:Fibronectin type-III domain-containing protein n=1 Tax=Candidatus Geothrix odensensis TaxID=2954440 RepID=A0A936K6D8_9BACT|nr:hypothetical protein [Candidatus Geothrix odensensis]
MTTSRILTTPILLLLATGAQGQIKTPPALTTATSATMLQPQAALLANLLPAGKTQGTFHLTGLVRKDRTVVLRWANDQGEMPTEGIRVFRQKVGDAAWKDLTGKKPLGFLQGKAAEKRLDAMPAEEREKLLSYPFGDVQHDPGTRLRAIELPKVSISRAKDLSPEKSLKQFRELRAAGKLNRSDLQLMHVRADVDLGMAEVLGLTYTDDPGKGQWRYKIQVGLPEGGSVEVVSPKVFNTLEPTPIPQPLSLSAASGNGEVLLNWDETPSDAVAGYNIYRAESPSGPWGRINSDPVKRVELELEDPELALRRSQGIQSGMERMLRPLPEAARTPHKVVEAHRQAISQLDKPGGLPALSAATAKAVKEAVASGRLRPGGRQAPKALYTDSRRTEGNALQNEKTYHYKVTALDLGGLEQPMETAPMVVGIPKDLEPPLVPGRPMLKTEMAARTDLRTAQAARLKDTRLVTLDQAISAKRPQATTALTPFQLQAQAPGAPTAAASSLSLGDAKRQQLSRTAATMPISALKNLGESAVLRSNADGSVPPALLAWAPSPDPDLKGYEVHRAGADGSFIKLADTTAPEWVDAGLVAGQAYRYAISSIDKLGNVSARSPEGRIEVSDSSLPGRLAISQFTGQVTKEAPAAIPGRRFLRPADRVLASGNLRSAKASILLTKATDSTVAEFHAPKAALVPRAKGQFSSVSAGKAPLAKDLTATPTLELSAVKASALVEACLPQDRAQLQSHAGRPGETQGDPRAARVGEAGPGLPHGLRHPAGPAEDGAGLAAASLGGLPGGHPGLRSAENRSRALRPESSPEPSQRRVQRGRPQPHRKSGAGAQGRSPAPRTRGRHSRPARHRRPGPGGLPGRGLAPVGGPPRPSGPPGGQGRPRGLYPRQRLARHHRALHGDLPGGGGPVRRGHLLLPGPVLHQGVRPHRGGPHQRAHRGPAAGHRRAPQSGRGLGGLAGRRAGEARCVPHLDSDGRPGSQGHLRGPPAHELHPGGGRGQGRQPGRSGGTPHLGAGGRARLHRQEGSGGLPALHPALRGCHRQPQRAARVHGCAGAGRAGSGSPDAAGAVGQPPHLEGGRGRRRLHSLALLHRSGRRL